MHSNIVTLGLLAALLTVVSALRIPPRVNASAACADGIEVCLWSGPILPRSAGFNDTSATTALSNRSASTGIVREPKTNKYADGGLIRSIKKYLSKERPLHGHSDIVKRDEHDVPWAFPGPHTVYDNGTTTTPWERTHPVRYMKITALGDVPTHGHKPPRVYPKNGASSRKHGSKNVKNLKQIKDMARLERKIDQDRERELARRDSEQLDEAGLNGVIAAHIKTLSQHKKDLAKRNARNALEEVIHYPETKAHRDTGRMDEFIRRQILADHHERHARLDHREKTKAALAIAALGKESTKPGSQATDIPGLF